MGPKATTTNFKFWPSLIFFGLFTAHSVCGKKPKTIEIRGHVIKKSIFWFSPRKSNTQMGSLSAKNASEKFSRLGTFNHTSGSPVCRRPCRGLQPPNYLPMYSPRRPPPSPRSPRTPFDAYSPVEIRLTCEDDPFIHEEHHGAHRCSSSKMHPNAVKSWKQKIRLNHSIT